MNTQIKNNNDVIKFYNYVKTKLEEGNKVQNAIKLAYRDLQRTLRGFNKCSEKESIKQKICNLIEIQYENLFEITINSHNFDKWHSSLCIHMKNIFANNYDFTIGQAQKWINMFCKYMFLVDERMNKFLLYLHIPIDNVILDGIEKHSCYFSLQKLVPSCRPWSKLDNYDVYLNFQKEFRYKFTNPLLHEFRLWNKWNNQNFNRFDDLTNFIDYFSNVNQEFYYFPPEIQCPVYTEECTNFLSAVSRYPVYDYREILINQGLFDKNLATVDFKKQDAQTILTIFTAITRSMYFGVECALGNLAKEGIICKMLYRLQEIDNSKQI